MGAPLNRVSLAYLNPENCVPAMGCPPTYRNPYCSASFSPSYMGTLLVPQQSITTGFLPI